jgi:hypothetical protein
MISSDLSGLILMNYLFLMNSGAHLDSDPTDYSLGQSGRRLKLASI